MWVFFVRLYQIELGTGGMGFGISTVAMAVALVSFFSGTRLYRHQRPGGSPFTRICQVIVASVRKWAVELPAGRKESLFETSDSEFVVVGSHDKV
ncbi:unnamed protein product [Linum trigynum]|uniref:Uncharacterized protein n=1 Tax=Linum trigynum TaxID=586398 RepID=A0AAV2GRG0_9ROSI